ncbi:MAG: hypothetical protein H0W06_00760, partial [Chloroflexia bacterium]|nr:hypothetical protein [Chloroflexia bacterium]
MIDDASTPTPSPDTATTDAFHDAARAFFPDAAAMAPVESTAEVVRVTTTEG